MTNGQRSFIEGFIALNKDIKNVKQVQSCVERMFGQWEDRFRDYLDLLKKYHYEIWIVDFYRLVSEDFHARVFELDRLIGGIDERLLECCKKAATFEGEERLDHEKELIRTWCGEEGLTRYVMEAEFEPFFHEDQRLKCLKLQQRIWELYARRNWHGEDEEAVFGSLHIASLTGRMKEMLRSFAVTYYDLGIEGFSPKDGENPDGRVLYHFLTERDPDTKEEKAFNEPNLKRFEQVLEEFSDIGGNMLAVWEKGSSVFGHRLPEEARGDFLYCLLLFSFHGMEPDAFSSCLIRYYPRLPFELRKKVYAKRMIIKTAFKVHEISRHSALMNLVWDGVRIYPEEELKALEARALRGIKSGTGLLDELSKALADASHGETDKSIYDRRIWDEVIKYREILVLFGPEQKREAGPGEYRVDQLITFIRNIAYGLEDDKLGYYGSGLWLTEADREILSSERHEMIKALNGINLELKNAKPSIEHHALKEVFDRLKEESLRYSEKLLIEDAGSMFAKLSDEMDQLRKQYEEEVNGLAEENERLREQYEEEIDGLAEENELLREDSENLRKIIEEMERKAEEAAEEIKRKANTELLNTWKEISLNKCREYEQEILSRLNREGSLLDGTTCRQAIEKELFTSEFVFHMLEQSERTIGAGTDYSVAILPLTKSVEIVLSELLYSRMSEADLESYTNNNGNQYLDTRKSPTVKKNKDEIELGPLAYLFKNDDPGVWKDPENGYKYVNYAVLAEELCGLKLTTGDGRETEFKGVRQAYTEEERTKADEENRRTIFRAIMHVAKKYRNPVAHKDMFGESGYIKAKELILSEHRLLWVLLAILAK